jgi:hypothetical protein
MRKFDEQFMTRFMIPLVKEIVTDIGKGEKNLFLHKLVNGEPLDATDKQQFISSYFETRQDSERKQPFADMRGEDPRDYWNKFLDGFSKYMILRYRLSGAQGAHDAFCPDKEGAFTQETTNNLYYLAYRISQDWENERIAKLYQGDTGKEEQLKEGNLKLVVDGNGVEKAITEDSDEVKADPSLAGDFAATRQAAGEEKYEKIVTKVADSGLKIAPNTFKNTSGQWNFSLEPGREGWLAGEVTDRDGNRLKVSVNPDAGEDDDKKYHFTFLNGTAPNGRPLAGYSFDSNESDLQGFKDKNAFDFAQKTKPEIAKEKAAPPLPAGLPGMGKGMAGGSGVPGMPPGGGVAIEGELPMEQEFKVTGKIITPRRGRIGARYPKMPPGAKGGVALPGGLKAKAPVPPPVKAPPPGTVQAKKDERARQEQQRRASAMAPAAPPAGQPGAGGEEAAAAPRPKKTPWWRTSAAKVVGAHAVIPTGIGALFGISGHAPNPNEVSAAIYMVLHNLGINFFS